MSDPNFEIYQNMSEHQHQVELFAWAAYARRFGFTQANEWLQLHPQALSRKTKLGHAPVPVGAQPPLKWLHAIPNGGARGDSRQSAAIVGSRLKAEGVKAGVADIFLPVPKLDILAHGLYIELKTLEGKPSTKQTEFLHDMVTVGYACEVCQGYLSAIETIKEYLR